MKHNHQNSPAQSLAPVGTAAVWLAFRRALVSQLHPKMLAALLMPFVIALLGVIVLLWAFWTPLTAWLDAQASQWDTINTIDGWMLAWGWVSIKLYIVPIMAAGILLPSAGILGLVIAAIFVMPIVLRHIERREYPGLKRQGEHAITIGTWNALVVGAVFVIGWVLTMPLWLFPPLAIVLPVFWWAFAFNRIMRVDALVEHATGIERRYLWRRHNASYWLIGLLLALLNLLPPMWLVLPVFSALVFAHYSLEALRRHRAGPPPTATVAGPSSAPSQGPQPHGTP